MFDNGGHMQDYPLNRLRNWVKGAFRSMTLWFNSMAGVLIVALPDLQGALPQLSSYLGPDAYKWLALIVVLSNIALRAKTSKSLSEKA